MAHITLLICDECARLGNNDTSHEVLTYTVQQGATRARVDLCREHDTVLRNMLIATGSDLPDPSRPPINEARFDELCGTMDDVDKAKKAWKKQQETA